MPNNSSGQLFLSAPWLLPMDSEAIAHGVLVIEGDRIKAVLAPEKLEKPPYAIKANQIHYYANAIIVPGLINLHSHLDYSQLSCLNGSSFYGWIKQLILRSQKWSQANWIDSALYGASMAALTGTTFIVDSSYSGAAAKALATVGLRGIVGLELFGIDESKDKLKWSEWKIRMSSLEETDDSHLAISLKNSLLELTVAPHAPYTVCPRLWRQAKDWALERNLPVLAHLAESRQEYEWISSSNNELDDFLAFVLLQERQGNGARHSEERRQQGSGGSECCQSGSDRLGLSGEILEDLGPTERGSRGVEARTLELPERISPGLKATEQLQQGPNTIVSEQMKTGALSQLIKWRGHGFSPVEHLRRHNLLDESLLAAHVIQIDDDDLKKLSDQGVKIAHCPRSNARLKAGYVNISKMLKAGLQVGLGTDSLASNDDLDLLNEARFALNLHNLIEKEFASDSKKMLSMITIDAARAIGKDHLIGSLTANKFADLAVFEFDGRQNFDEVNPYDLVLHGRSKLKELIVGGKTIAKDGELTSAFK